MTLCFESSVAANKAAEYLAKEYGSDVPIFCEDCKVKIISGKKVLKIPTNKLAGLDYILTM